MSELITCPGCAVALPSRDDAVYDGSYNTTPECWAVYSDVLGREFANAILFGHAHQLTVDTYAIQHAGAKHPDKSVAIHLAGLHLVLDKGLKPPQAAPVMQRLAQRVDVWPHFEPPEHSAKLTILDIALTETPDSHIKLVREWAEHVWDAWAVHHGALASLLARSGM